MYVCIRNDSYCIPNIPIFADGRDYYLSEILNCVIIVVVVVIIINIIIIIIIVVVVVVVIIGSISISSIIIKPFWQHYTELQCSYMKR